MPAAPVPENVRHLHEQLSELGAVECRRFFGGWGFRRHGVQFASVLRGRLYLHADATLRAALADAGSEPFRYEKKGRTVTVERFQSMPEEALDDPEALLDWARRALAAGR